MLKGVNRKVMEINQTESDYFERAVFYLRPDVNEAPLHAAQLEVQALCLPSYVKIIKKYMKSDQKDL